MFTLSNSKWDQTHGPNTTLSSLSTTLSSSCFVLGLAKLERILKTENHLTESTPLKPMLLIFPFAALRITSLL